MVIGADSLESMPIGGWLLCLVKSPEVEVDEFFPDKFQL
jgi:hypothetical protein